MMRYKKYLAYILLFISYALFGIYHPVQKQGLNSGHQPIEFAFASMFFCSLFLFPFAFRNIRKHKIKFKKNDILEFALLGFLATALGLSLKLYGLSLTSANNVALIAATSGIFLTIFARLIMKEELPGHFLPIIILMSFGLFLFKSSSFKFTSFGVGDFFTILYVIALTIATTLAKKYMFNFSSTIISAARIIFGLPFLFLFYLLFLEVNINALFSFWAVLAGFIFAFRVLAYYKAISLTKLSNVAIFTVISPLITFAYSFIFFGEILNGIQIAGVVIILIGIYLHIKIKSKSHRVRLKSDKIDDTFIK